MSNNLKEKIIITSSETISLKQTVKIIEQMKSNFICKTCNNSKGNRFFVKIPFK